MYKYELETVCCRATYNRDTYWIRQHTNRLPTIKLETKLPEVIRVATSTINSYRLIRVSVRL